MRKNPRCLYDNSIVAFISDIETSILGTLCDNYHGVALTTTREAWKEEISIMQDTLVHCGEKNGHIIFEYDIPRLGKRIDVVLLLKGIVFCIELENAGEVVTFFDSDKYKEYVIKYGIPYVHKEINRNKIIPLRNYPSLHFGDLAASLAADNFGAALGFRSDSIIKMLYDANQKFIEEDKTL